MRSDLNKVVTERPRHPGYHGNYPKGAKRAVQRLDLNDLPSRESIRKKWQRGFNSKEFSDFLSPLYRWLESNVGRPWNKVYSEFREHFYPSGKSLQHINTHFKDAVVKDVVMIDGKPCVVNHMWRGSNVPLSSGELYVDPRTGILRQVKDRKPSWKTRPPKEITSIVISKDIQFHKLSNGIWYEITVRPFDPKKFTTIQDVALVYSKRTIKKPVFFYTDRVSGNRFTEERVMLGFYHGAFEPISKRQLSRKELKAHNLTNTPNEKI